MRRVLAIVLCAAAAGGFVVLAGGAGDDASGKPSYTVELDNAFGLIEGGDLKIAGVRAGKIDKLRLDQRTRHALVDFTITQDGFGDLRADTTCDVQPQSLVGEYFVDCYPGKSSKRLKPHATIPVERTTSTIPPDLVGNILRRPYRERLTYILSELGAAVAGNGDELNAALRRANPALRETNKVLAMLAKQNQVLADLTRNADTVMGDLAANRTDVGRWVVEARDTARASAERDRDIARGFERLPTFLSELRPTMDQLGKTVDAQGPALRNLAASADDLKTFFNDVQPFADANRPGVKALGEASKTGRGAVKAATPTVAELNTYATGVPELGKNLAIVLEHLDDRSHAAETDPRSPGGKGYTGLEALLQYVFDQTLSTNVHDGSVHILKAFPFQGQCAEYADIATAKKLAKDCSTALGPNQVGINFFDGTKPDGWNGDDSAARNDPDPKQPKALSERAADTIGRRDAQPPAAPDQPSSGATDHGPQVPAPSAPGVPPAPPVQVPGLDHILPGDAPKPEAPKLPSVDATLRDAPKTGLSARDERHDADRRLLDFLLGS